MTPPDPSAEAANPEGNDASRRAWEANADFWDDRMGEGNLWVERLCWPHLERLIEVRPGERVLDVACGNGLTSRRLAALGANVVAFDFSAPLLEHARARTEADAPIEYRQLDATDEAALFALGENAFDAALSNMALMDIADVAPLFRALARLLRPGGRFVFTVPHPAFQGAHTTLVAERTEDAAGLHSHYGVRIGGYLQAEVHEGVAIEGQPVAQPYFHRPLNDLLRPAFEVGLVLDALEEPAFTEADRDERRGPHWANMPGIPPVIVVRLRRPA
ncbi:MAG: class I SAM-dependent methyltransferase [Dehalococcoidia bacterium]